MKTNQKGIGLVSTLFLFTLLAAFLAAVGLVLSQERARVRDAHRITDMVRVQYAFATLYQQTASYAGAAEGCGTVGMPVSTCSLSTYLPSIATLEDPGKSQYVVRTVPNETDYAVEFTLERGYETLAKGKHVVTKDGIQ